MKRILTRLIIKLSFWLLSLVKIKVVSFEPEESEE
jgi:hypothetical protein